MKDINREKLWAYLEKRFNELGDEYDRQMENAKAAKDDENINSILHRMTAATEKRVFIIELKNEILGGRLE